MFITYRYIDGLMLLMDISVLCSRDDSVIIWDNMTHWCCKNKMSIYAKRLAELDASIDINCKAQRTPILIKGSEQQQLALKMLICNMMETNLLFLVIMILWMVMEARLVCLQQVHLL